MSFANRYVPKVAPTITVAHRIPSLRARSQLPGLTTIILEYLGKSGTGAFHGPMLLAVDNKVVDGRLPLDVEHALRDLCTTLLAERFPSWKDGEGSLGQFYWHLPSDRIRQYHNVRIPEAEWEAMKETCEAEYDGDSTDLHVPF